MSKLLTHARLDPPLGLSAAFGLVERNKTRPPLDVSQHFGGTEFRWCGPEQLTVVDQSVLLALVALGATGAGFLPADTQTKTGKFLRDGLKLEGRVAGATFTAVRCSWRGLAAARGAKNQGGSSLAQVRAAMQRLSKVEVQSECDGDANRSQLLSWMEEAGGQLIVALSWGLSNAIRGGQHARICLLERQSLRSDSARILHAWLSSCLRPGGSHDFPIDNLARRVWPENASDRARSSRRSELRTALNGIARLPAWQIAVTGVTVTAKRLTPVRQVGVVCASSLGGDFEGRSSNGAGLRRPDAHQQRTISEEERAPPQRAFSGAPKESPKSPRSPLGVERRKARG